MHKDHESFISAIHNKTLIRLTFYSDKDSKEVTRLCAPMDYALSAKAKDGLLRYHFWDYQGTNRPHNVGLLNPVIIHMEFLSDIFDPADFVTWAIMKWTIKRAWGQYS